MAKRPVAVVANGKKKRRKPNPELTHELMLIAARKVAADGEESLSLSAVARRAGVHRSTAYQHFRTREELVSATSTSVSDALCDALLSSVERNEPAVALTTAGLSEHVARLAIEQPELGRAWLTHFLTADRPDTDSFLQLCMSLFEAFGKTEHAQADVDVEVHTVMVLAATTLWPIWIGAHAANAEKREQMTQRFTREIQRLSLRGIFLRPLQDTGAAGT